jgi:hypothetical protein
VKSGAWNKALERLTSSTGLVKELETRKSELRRRLVSDRFFKEESKEQLK